MRSSHVNLNKPFPLIRIVLIALLTVLLSGWTTCTAIIGFSSCPGAVPQPQIAALSPESIPGNVGSVFLTVNGSDFVPKSQILWNGNALRTTFTDSTHLQAIITQQTFDDFGGSAGNSVQIAVRSPGTDHVFGCPNGGSSGVLVLVIN
jgi:hypothetical protein